MSPARRVLERLLHRAERARLRGADRHASLPMGSQASAGEYLGLRTLPELETFHAEIALAERAGAIEVQRSRSGDGTKLQRLTVADLGALARHLGVRPLDEQAGEAEQRLATWMPRFPVIAQVLERWRQGRKVRGQDAGAARELADAALAAAAVDEEPGRERILRRESVRLFRDSKRLERLTPWLELLVTGELAASGLAREDVWAALGLRREPQPLLLAGDGEAMVGGIAVPIATPFIGFAPQAVEALATTARYLLSIENLASFHDAAAQALGHGALLVYTGGMPSPAWRVAYRRLLAGLPPSAPAWHWGDIDEGGFRIAAALAQETRTAGREFKPWQMSPDDLDGAALASAGSPTEATAERMCRWAEQAGWAAVAAALRRHPLTLEQEAIGSMPWPSG
ncbi:Wadjet anti-phage system protein JetD domain-containing protein [Luteimonas sp. R10]|uniref:Wadjet anti-phage system protein JetD domain-containing protein n=1 Tax=Luteimonas sp. R10 TaxID=3108176 RepID=UPI003085D815|nr:Wadjet anti-phage system protein JetD domain-containing protein [Luteimonas sp. R10]